MLKILPPEKVVELDQSTLAKEGISSFYLMNRASLAFIRKFTEVIRPHHTETVNIYCGPGNNGGDGFCIARYLAFHGFRINTYLLNNTAIRPDTDLEKAVEAFKKQGLTYDTLTQSTEIPPADIHIDALFGAGLNRPLTGEVATAVENINACEGLKISVDTPSGLLPLYSSEPIVLRADYTLTFQFPFPAFFEPFNMAFTGILEVIDIGLDQDYITKSPSKYFLAETCDIKLPRRFNHGHKGIYGHLMAVAGELSKLGAAHFAALAGFRAGAGLTSVFTGNEIKTAIFQSLNSNLMCIEHKLGIPDSVNAVVIGPGLGLSNEARILLQGMLTLARERSIRVILDADGLNLLSLYPDSCNDLLDGAILTPHPKEFDRLCDSFNLNDKSYIERAGKLAEKLKCYVVLKNSFTSIHTPDGLSCFIHRSSKALSKGGSGDVLAGIIGSFCAQGVESFDACVSGVLVHAGAGIKLEMKKGSSGGSALELTEFIPEYMEERREG